jgi:hypothetical protein
VKRWKHISQDGSEIYLVDAPGFNDSRRSDMEILRKIVSYIWSRQLTIVGVIYLHKITEKKITGSSRQNLRMLRAVCGEHYIQNLILATTMWGTVPQNSLKDTMDREVELHTSKSFWGDLIDRGAVYTRWDATSEGAREIVAQSMTRENAPRLEIILEMEKGFALEDTTAGKILTEQIRKQQEKDRAALEDEEEETRGLQKEREDLQSRVQNLEQYTREQQQEMQTQEPRFARPNRRGDQRNIGASNSNQEHDPHRRREYRRPRSEQGKGWSWKPWENW